MSDGLSDLLKLSRPLVMGILNATPDSFSDGGLHQDPDVAVAAAFKMCSEGADLIDIGGESTRPGSQPVDPTLQIKRVLPIVERLTRANSECSGPVLSIDTTSAQVAEACINAGCQLVNDVSAGMGDARMLDLVADLGVHIVLMHMQGTPNTMQINPSYQDVLREVTWFLEERVQAAVNAGISPEKILLDPGIGFGKSKEHNLDLLRGLERIVQLGFPLVLGCSRKRFMGSLCKEEDPMLLTGATVATTAFGVMMGARVFRVHEVRPNRQAADVTWALRAKTHAF